MVLESGLRSSLSDNANAECRLTKHDLRLPILRHSANIFMNPPTQPACPVCQTPLRLPSRGTAPVEVPCPECGEMLWISFQEGKVLVAQDAAADASTTPGTKVPHRPRLTIPAWLSQFGNWAGSALREPLVLTWLAAGVAACVLGVAFYRASLGPVTASARVEVDSGQENRAASTEPDEKNEQVILGPQSTDKPPAVKPNVSSAVSPIASAEAEPTTTPIPPPVPSRRPVLAGRPETPPADLRAKAERGLAQRVLRFEQTVPTVFETLRDELAEIVGVPIRYAEGTEPIMTEVSLTVTDATLGEVLEELVRQVGLSYQVDQKGILLIRE